MNFVILVAMRYIQGRVLGSFILIPSLAYLLILHCWDEYRRGAKGNVGAQISTRSDCPDSELHQLSSS